MEWHGARHTRFDVSVTPGNSRRSSTAAANSPRCSKTARIAAASSSVTTNIPRSMSMHCGTGKLNTWEGAVTFLNGPVG